MGKQPRAATSPSRPAPACRHRWAAWQGADQFALRCRHCGARALLTQYADRVEAALLPDRDGGLPADAPETVARCLRALGVPEPLLARAAVTRAGPTGRLLLPGLRLPAGWPRLLGALPGLGR